MNLKVVKKEIMFSSKLPVDVNKNEIIDFLRTNNHYEQLLLDNWSISNAEISIKSKEYLNCLHEDLSECYKTPFAFDINGNEDRNEEYRILREWLFSKYYDLGEDIIYGIYHTCLRVDR